VQKCLLERKLSYLTEKGLFSRKAAAAEDWEARLGALILGADAVVFILSLAAVRSERCAS
jgi:hypothetical protein